MPHTGRMKSRPLHKLQPLRSFAPAFARAHSFHATQERASRGSAIGPLRLERCCAVMKRRERLVTCTTAPRVGREAWCSDSISC